MQTYPNRHYNKWTMNEINRLHNEYELKELDIYQIAALHERTEYGILNQLAREELIDSSWIDARGWVQPNLSMQNNDIILESCLDDVSEVSSSAEYMNDHPNNTIILNLVSRMKSMETTVTNILDYLVRKTTYQDVDISDELHLE